MHRIYFYEGGKNAEKSDTKSTKSVILFYLNGTTEGGDGGGCYTHNQWTGQKSHCAN